MKHQLVLEERNITFHYFLCISLLRYMLLDVCYGLKEVLKNARCFPFHFCLSVCFISARDFKVLVVTSLLSSRCPTQWL